MGGGIFGDVGVSLFVAGASPANGRGRDDEFNEWSSVESWLGHARIIVGSAAHWNDRFIRFASQLAALPFKVQFHFSWQAQYLVQLE